MLKYAIAAAVAGMFSIAPAFAAGDLKCTDADMKKLGEMIHEMSSDPAMKHNVEMAMAEEQTAMAAAHRKHLITCKTHLNKAEMELMAHN